MLRVHEERRYIRTRSAKGNGMCHEVMSAATGGRAKTGNKTFLSGERDGLGGLVNWVTAECVLKGPMV